MTDIQLLHLIQDKAASKLPITLEQLQKIADTFDEPQHIRESAVAMLWEAWGNLDVAVPQGQPHRMAVVPTPNQIKSVIVQWFHDNSEKVVAGIHNLHDVIDGQDSQFENLADRIEHLINHLGTAANPDRALNASRAFPAISREERYSKILARSLQEQLDIQEAACRIRFPRDHASIGDGYRLLEDYELLEATDETVCVSTLLAGMEEWHSVMPTWEGEIGWTIQRICDETDDADARERLFRRKKA